MRNLEKRLGKDNETGSAFKRSALASLEGLIL